jgi:ribosomal-protein-alanine N-acetyltransferase
VSAYDDIVGGRLMLRLIPPAALQKTVEGDIAAVAQLTGLSISQEWTEVAPLAKRRLSQLEADPDYLPWSIRALALRDTRHVVGYVNFHAAPGSDEIAHYAPKAVELGYTVNAPHRRRGYGGEAVRLLIAWARTRGADAFVFSISPHNRASLALVARLGAVKVGSHIDEEDGPEDEYLLKTRDDNGDVGRLTSKGR